MKTITPKSKFYFLNFNKTLALVFIFSFFAIACNKNDDIIEPEVPVVTEPEVPIVTNPLFKTWKLVYFQQLGPAELFTNGEIQWTINDNNTIDVVNISNSSSNINLPLKETGTYLYIINNNVLELYNIFYYENYYYEIVNNQLIIVQTVGQAADGKVLKFD